jgi:hypothetical protein
MIENLHRVKSIDASPAITTNHALLTTAWTADVKVLEAALSRSNVEGRLNGGCRVVFFEVAGDSQLHVNVIHRDLTRNMSGWAGPGRTPDGLIHNRAFSRAPRYQILRQIRDMVFASRI